MNYLFIINPLSGPSKNREKIKELIIKKLGQKAEIKVTSYAGQASEFASEGLSKGCKNIIAVGGDGTINEIAKVLVKTDTCLGIIPMGSGNGLARSLHLSLQPKKALQKIMAHQTKSIDVGSANGKYFFVVGGVGFEAQVAKRFQKSKKRGPVPYFFNGLKELFVYSYPNIFVESEEFASNIKPLTIAIANAPQYGNGAMISPQSDMSDGFLDVCLLTKMNVIQSVKALKYLFSGKINNLTSYETFTSRDISISSKENIFFHTDGEVHDSIAKIVFKIIPKALNVIC